MPAQTTHGFVYNAIMFVTSPIRLVARGSLIAAVVLAAAVFYVATAIKNDIVSLVSGVFSVVTTPFRWAGRKLFGAAQPTAQQQTQAATANTQQPSLKTISFVRDVWDAITFVPRYAFGYTDAPKVDAEFVAAPQGQDPAQAQQPVSAAAQAEAQLLAAEQQAKADADAAAKLAAEQQPVHTQDPAVRVQETVPVAASSKSLLSRITRSNWVGFFPTFKTPTKPANEGQLQSAAETKTYGLSLKSCMR